MGAAIRRDRHYVKPFKDFERLYDAPDPFGDLPDHIPEQEQRRRPDKR